jgi:hypothetical protein
MGNGARVARLYKEFLAAIIDSSTNKYINPVLIVTIDKFLVPEFRDIKPIISSKTDLGADVLKDMIDTYVNDKFQELTNKINELTEKYSSAEIPIYSSSLKDSIDADELTKAIIDDLNAHESFNNDLSGKLEELTSDYNTSTDMFELASSLGEAIEKLIEIFAASGGSAAGYDLYLTTLDLFGEQIELLEMTSELNSSIQMHKKELESQLEKSKKAFANKKSMAALLVKVKPTPPPAHPTPVKPGGGNEGSMASPNNELPWFPPMNVPDGEVEIGDLITDDWFYNPYLPQKPTQPPKKKSVDMDSPKGRSVKMSRMTDGTIFIRITNEKIEG